MQGSMPFPFATATPTPTATPEPTPTPTPKPEPTVYPTVTLNCISSARQAISKSKLPAPSPITKQEFQARLYTSALALTAETNGKLLTVQTHADGSFEAVWTPNATGSYLLCARWSGKRFPALDERHRNLATISDISGQRILSCVKLNVSNLGYNSTKRELHLQTRTGTQARRANAQVCIPKL